MSSHPGLSCVGKRCNAVAPWLGLLCPQNMMELNAAQVKKRLIITQKKERLFATGQKPENEGFQGCSGPFCRPLAGSFFDVAHQRRLPVPTNPVAYHVRPFQPTLSHEARQTTSVCYPQSPTHRITAELANNDFWTFVTDTDVIFTVDCSLFSFKVARAK